MTLRQQLFGIQKLHLGNSNRRYSIYFTLGYLWTLDWGFWNTQRNVEKCLDLVKSWRGATQRHQQEQPSTHHVARQHSGQQHLSCQSRIQSHLQTSKWCGCRGLCFQNAEANLYQRGTEEASLISLVLHHKIPPWNLIREKSKYCNCGYFSLKFQTRFGEPGG